VTDTEAVQARLAIATFAKCDPADLTEPRLVDGIFVALIRSEVSEDGLPINFGGGYILYSPVTKKVASGSSLPPSFVVSQFRDLVD
jgi:hypothetical protein